MQKDAQGKLHKDAQGKIVLNNGEEYENCVVCGDDQNNNLLSKIIGPSPLAGEKILTWRVCMFVVH